MIKPTITDIANEMGITPSTVSRALAGSPRVKESTREAIERKAKEMGYERNVMASNLRKGVAKTVGIIVPRINRQFFSNVISSAESILEEAGYTVIICQSHETLEDEIKALKTMRANQVAGVLISHSIQSVNGDHILENIHDVYHVGGEGGQGLFDALLVADIGEDLAEHGQLALIAGRYMQAGHAHEGQKADRL